MKNKTAFYRPVKGTTRFVAHDSETGVIVIEAGDLPILAEYCDKNGYDLKPKPRDNEE